MIRISAALILAGFLLLFAGCKKHSQSETILMGTWIKGTNAGDTLQFIRKNNKNILRYNPSFNPSLPGISEKEYIYLNGKLSIKLFSPFSEDFYPIDSFTWKRVGVEFEIQGIQLFSILSSTQVHFIYRKI